MIVRDLLTKWKILVDDKALTRMQREIRKVRKEFKKAGQTAIKFGKSLSTFVTLPLLLLGGALIKTASDAEETASKFDVVFSTLREESNKTAEQLKRDFGLSRNEAKTLLSDTGDLLTGFGFTQKSALDLSSQVQKLAVDLASFTNFAGGAEGASKALTKALLGERESVKSLGISILEEDVKRKVALNTAKGMTFETERQAKAFATLQIAQDQSKNAIGDFARTSQGFANRLRTMGARVNDVAVSFGQILLPPALKLLNVFIRFLEILDSISPQIKTVILVVGGLAAALGPLLIAIGIGAKLLVLLKGGFIIASKAMTAFSLKAILSAALIIAAFVAIILIFDDLLAFFQGRKSVFGAIVLGVDEMLLKFQTAFPAMSEVVLAFIGSILAPIKAVIGAVRALSGLLGTLAGGGGIKDALSVAGSEFTSAFSDFAKISLGQKVGLQDILGIGGIRQKALGTSVANAETGAAASGGNNITVQVNSPVTVPPGTPPELVGSKIKEGVMAAMNQTFRETREAVEPEVAF